MKDYRRLTMYDYQAKSDIAKTPKLTDFQRKIVHKALTPQDLKLIYGLVLGAAVNQTGYSKKECRELYKKMEKVFPEEIQLKAILEAN